MIEGGQIYLIFVAVLLILLTLFAIMNDLLDFQCLTGSFP